MVGNSAWLLSARVAAIPVGVVQSVLTARLLGVEGYGVLAIVVTFVATLNQLTSFRMNEFMVKHVADAQAAGRRDLAAAAVKVALLAEAAASLVSFALVWATAGLAADWFVGRPEAAGLLRLYAVFVLGNLVFESATGIFQIFDRYRVQAATALAVKVLMLAGVAVVWLRGGGLAEVVLAFALANALPSLVASGLAFREVARQLGNGWWRTPISILSGSGARMRSFAASTNVSSTLSILVKDADALWLGWLSSPLEVGYYRLASTLVKLVLLPGNPLVQAAYPEIARTISRGETERTRSLLRQSTWLAAAWIVPLAVVLAAAGPWLIPAFYGAEFAPAAAPLALLLAGMGLSQVLFWNRPTILALGRPDYALRLTVLNAVLKVGLVLLLVPALGSLGMAAITAGLFALGALLSTRFVARALRRVSGPSSAPPLPAVLEPDSLASEAE
jgi:O-antigen/teichoic acid export membrane protein